MKLLTTIAFTLILALLALRPTFAFTQEPGAVPQTPLPPVVNDPNLPNVLLIGDSICYGYSDDVRTLLEGKANVYRIGIGNSGEWVTDLPKWLALRHGNLAVVHFNCGLHDIKLAPGGKGDQLIPYPQGHEVTPTDYEANLRHIVDGLQPLGATLIFATCTPVPAGNLNPPRNKGDEVIYNNIALRVMQEKGVTIDDLYSLVLPQESKIQLPNNTHYTPAGYMILAQQVAASIETALAARKAAGK